MGPTTTAHETRVDRAFALNGWVVFCSCGKLTGFADTAAGADEVASDHVAKHAEFDCGGCGTTHGGPGCD